MHNKPDKKKIRSILFLTLSNLGDIILTTPVLEMLHDEFPEASIDVITGGAGLEIFTQHPAVREVSAYRKKRKILERLSEVIALRKKKYDLVVDLKNTLIPYLVGAKYHTKLSLLKERNVRHKKDEHLLKLTAMGIEPSSHASFFIPCGDDEKRFIREVTDSSSGKRIVVINPGAKSHLKRWGAKKYAELSDRLISELGCRVFVTGNQDDREVVGEFKSFSREVSTDLSSKTSVGSLAELMKRSSLVITNDSAPLHVASATNTPTLAIFGPSDDRKYGPLAEKSVTVKPKMECRPCGRALCNNGPAEGCIIDVEVEEVFEKAKEMLAGA